jgi:hypothetical protein
VSSICRAIRSQSLVRFWYEGLPRVVEPYLHGTSTAGTEALRGFQVGGGSRHGGPPWRLFTVTKITNIVMLDESFVIRPKYRRNDRAFRAIHCRVA